MTTELEKARRAAQRPSNQPTSYEHKAELDALENQRTQVGKQLKQEEANVTKKEAELTKWKSEKEEVEKLQVGDEGDWANGKVYANLMGGAMQRY